MAAEGGRIDFMFLAPPYPAAGSATEILHSNVNKLVFRTNLVSQGLFEIITIEVVSKHLKVGREDTL